MQVNKPALDRKMRRKANRQQRAEGGRVLDLSGLQKRAESDVRLRCKLGELARDSKATATDRAAAAKAKRKLNDTWTNRKSKSLGDAWIAAHSAPSVCVSVAIN